MDYLVAVPDRHWRSNERIALPVRPGAVPRILRERTVIPTAPLADSPSYKILLMKTAASILALIVATTVQASAQPAEVRATGEHRPTVGDTADSARRLALVDARGNTLRAVVTRLQTRADVKNLRLTPSQLEAFAAVIVEVEAEPGPAAPAGGRTPVQVRARTRLDAADVVRR